MFEFLSEHVGHPLTSFLSSNYIGKISIDPTLSSTSTSDANYVVSSDIYDDQHYMCDTPLKGDSSCSCAISSKGLVPDGGSRLFPGSVVDGSNTASIGPLGIQGAVNGVPHPSFRFAQKISDLKLTLTDVTFPGKERVMWDAAFRLTGPDGSMGSDYLPSSLAPIGGNVQTFHKLCSAVNSFRKYSLVIDSGGDAQIHQKIGLVAKIVQPPGLLDPALAAKNPDAVDADGTPSGSLKAVGPRLYQVGYAPDGSPIEPGASPPGSATVPAVQPVSGFAEIGDVPAYPTIHHSDSTVLLRPESRTFPSVTATSFACGCGEKPIDPPNCYKPPTVTVHYPGGQTSGFF